MGAAQLLDDWCTRRRRHKLTSDGLLLSLITLFGASGVALAPIAAATPQCTYTTPTTTQCERPGNAQINTSPPVNYNDTWGWPWWGWGGGISIGIPLR
jgi:hypothetical protein